MWCKCNSCVSGLYDPHIINLDTGARIYAEADAIDSVDGLFSIYRIFYEHPKLEGAFLMKSVKIPDNWFEDEDNYGDTPLSSEIDKIFEEIQKGKDFDIK